MNTSLQRHRQRTRRTQLQVAEMLLTTKPNICNVEKGRRNLSADIIMTGFERCDDPIFLTDINFEISNGYTVPAANEQIFDDHRICIKERLLNEIEEVVEVLNHIRIDKRPDYCTKDEIENVRRIAAETYDVVFEAQSLINKIILDYNFNPQELAQSRNQRLKMERRI
ncbi:HTH cro/C1-type domain-containing protein [Macrococcoides canis]|uniref:HTH cro/C1-type domain-containing protein n=1 Tax=Macrococcoides canis TaxID=1855823 RepID=A0A1W7ABW5_9STAP|nr:hypothetical protein [Macrococcus canis]ARQ07102.1 hypothetical protein MCCS_14610 [Macrococcus canis]